MVADVCGIGDRGDVCDEWEHDEGCDDEHDDNRGTSPPTPGRLLPSLPPMLRQEHGECIMTSLRRRPHVPSRTGASAGSPHRSAARRRALRARGFLRTSAGVAVTGFLVMMRNMRRAPQTQTGASAGQEHPRAYCASVRLT